MITHLIPIQRTAKTHTSPFYWQWQCRHNHNLPPLVQLPFLILVQVIRVLVVMTESLDSLVTGGYHHDGTVDHVVG